jgi:hypothetical protein
MSMIDALEDEHNKGVFRTRHSARSAETPEIMDL